jgi:hypothetical protein
MIFKASRKSHVILHRRSPLVFEPRAAAPRAVRATRPIVIRETTPAFVRTAASFPVTEAAPSAIRKATPVAIGEEASSAAGEAAPVRVRPDTTAGPLGGLAALPTSVTTMAGVIAGGAVVVVAHGRGEEVALGVDAAAVAGSACY